ncbi:MAG: cysteine synthase A [Clostridia bacterium]|nr:cysteine synthase A [Clostridia bacterium]
MSKIYGSVQELIGNTPLVRLATFSAETGTTLLAKLEGFNPAGSAKDRVAKAIVDAAEQSGKLQKGGTVVEATSGNTGIGLALVARARGYKAVIVMPETMSVERQKLIRAYGAEVVLTAGKKGMAGAVEKAEEIVKNTPNSIMAGQFVNPANVKAHYETTAREIWEDTCGKVDIFVAGVGTGGTLTGVGRYLKEQKPSVRVVAVEPQKSPLLSAGTAGAHGIQGIGANFVPAILDRNIYDEIITVSDEAAFETGRLLCKTEGIFAGISSGAALCGAIELAHRKENTGKTIVVLLPDEGGRYLSTPLFE